MKRTIALAATFTLLLTSCGQIAETDENSNVGAGMQSDNLRSDADNGTSETADSTASPERVTDAEDETSQNENEESSETDNSSENDGKRHKTIPDTVTLIPDGEENELVFFGNIDLNESDDPAVKVQLKLFEACGGTVKTDRYYSSNDRYDELAMRIISGGDVPDMMWMDNYTFPAYAVKEFFQPVDSIVDLDSDLWAETKSTADLYSINGSHYAAPISVTPTALLLYRKDIVENYGLADPYELYLNGEWNRDSFYSVMEDFCTQDGHYGINGYFSDPLFRAEGLPIVSYDGSEFKNNMNNERVIPIVDFLYDIKDNG